MAALDSVTELNGILEEWNRDQDNPMSALKRLAELVEKETEAYFKMDPDPFDDRHPGRANPNCALGHLMKALFKYEEFMNKLVSVYIMSARDQVSLHTAACRLLLDVLPALETSVVFQQTEGIVRRLIHWSETAHDPLRSYATGLLAGAMELQDVAPVYKEQSATLVPMMLRRLHELKNQSAKEQAEDDQKRHFGSFSKTPEKKQQSLDSSPEKEPTETPQKSTECSGSVVVPTHNGFDSKHSPSLPLKCSTPSDEKNKNHKAGSEEPSPEAADIGQEHAKNGHKHLKTYKRALSPSFYSEDVYRLKKTRKISSTFGSTEWSNSSWAELEPYVIGSYCLDPLSTTMKQRLILQYLTPMGEYQELISAAYEHNALDLIFYYINLKQNTDVRLAFEALKYLATLLCHKKFAIEFLQLSGVQKLLEVYRPSIAATGVSLCLYYLAYFEDAMERVCLLPDHVLSDLVSYILWLLECSHDSSRCHAAMFFSQAFPFRVILELFDQKDGLRRLFNVISTLEILNVDDPNSNLTEDQIFTMRQSARHVCVALKKYFEAHLALKVDEIKRSHARNEGNSPLHETPAYKAMKLTPSVVQDNIDLLMELMPIRLHWTPESAFHKLGGIPLLVQLVAMAPDWNNYPGKPETIKAALDVIAVCTVTPKSQIKLLEAIPLPEDMSTPAISVMMGLAEGDVLADPEVQKSALSVTINCVCGPVERLGGGMGRYMGAGKRRINLKLGEDVLSRMCNGVRTNNGIMVLLKLLTTKTPITDADCIRALACKALVGLSRSETVRQIISKLPIFNNGQLQFLMKEPVLQDKNQEHVKFCKYASQLLERVSGKHPNANIEASLEDIRKADIVAQTRIIFQEKELLRLIHSHLMAKGLIESAGALQREASLPRCTTPPPLPFTTSPHAYSAQGQPATPKLARQFSHPPTGHQIISPCSSTHSMHSNHSNTQLDRDSQFSTPGTPGPIRFSLSRHNQTSPTNGTPSRVPSKSRLIKEREQMGATLHSPAFRHKGTIMKGQPEYEMTLDKIVTEYLRKQHALCRNPVVTCPPMSLFSPHRCPDPKGRNTAPTCITSRVFQRGILPQHGGMEGAKYNRKYIYSRFRPIRTYRDGEDEGYSCCAFSACEQFLILGTYSGDLKLTNLQTGDEAGSFPCHSSPISHCEPSRDGKLVLTAATWGTPYGSALWSFGDVVNNKYFFEDHHLEFSKLTQDRIIGTKDETAHIYDAATGQLVLKLYDGDNANNYRANRATLNPTDELALNDGVLWDVRAGKSIHKFDKFNTYISGVFHPMGLEIIINSEVWDIRNFHLLHTVPALDQCQIRFSHAGDVIYATHIDEELDITEERFRSPYGSTFRTFDATDYSSIATTDVKSRSIAGLCTDRYDCYLAVVEQYTETGSEENVCRLYEVGKLKDEEDDQVEDDDEEEVDDDDDDDDDDVLQLDDSLSDASAAEIEALLSSTNTDDNGDEEDNDAEGDSATDDNDDEDDMEDGEGDDDDDDDDGDIDLDDDILFELV